MVAIPGTGCRGELVLNDIVDATIEAVEAAIRTQDCRLGYAMTAHGPWYSPSTTRKTFGSSTTISSGPASPSSWSRARVEYMH